MISMIIYIIEGLCKAVDGVHVLIVVTIAKHCRKLSLLALFYGYIFLHARLKDRVLPSSGNSSRIKDL